MLNVYAFALAIVSLYLFMMVLHINGIYPNNGQSIKLMLYFHQLFAYQVTNRMEYMACCYMDPRQDMVKFAPFLFYIPPLSRLVSE